jgi:hypothetical protein
LSRITQAPSTSTATTAWFSLAVLLWTTTSLTSSGGTPALCERHVLGDGVVLAVAAADRLPRRHVLCHGYSDPGKRQRVTGRERFERRAAPHGFSYVQSAPGPAQNVDTEGKTQAAPRKDANAAVTNAGTDLTPSNQAVPPETVPVPEAGPFGLAAEDVSEGEILRKWTGVESKIREDRQILAHCREDASSCPLAAQRFLAIVDEGRARSGRARIGVIKS